MVGIEAGILDERQNQSSEDDNTANGEKRSWDSTRGVCLEEPKKRRGRPPGSKNKGKGKELGVTMVRDFEGAARPMALNLRTGCNIIRCLAEFCNRNQIGISILASRGLVCDVQFQSSNLQPPLSWGGPSELKRLSGSFMPRMWNLPCSILSATLEGQITGDIFEDNLWAAAPVTVVVICLANPGYYDISFGQDDNGGAHYANGIGNGNMHLPVALPSSSASHYAGPPNYAAHQNNGYSMAYLAHVPPPSSSHANANVQPATTAPHQPTMMNNNDHTPLPPIGSLPNLPNSSLVSLPNPANGHGYYMD